MACYGRATREDVSSLLPLMAAFSAAEGIPYRPEAVRPALERLIDESELGLVVTCRIESQGSIVGYGVGSFGYDLEFRGRDAFVTELFVASSSRGQGLGRALLCSLLSELGWAGARAVHLLVRPENTTARSLYESEGLSASDQIFMTRKTAGVRSTNSCPPKAPGSI